MFFLSFRCFKLHTTLVAEHLWLWLLRSWLMYYEILPRCYAWHIRFLAHTHAQRAHIFGWMEVESMYLKLKRYEHHEIAHLMVNFLSTCSVGYCSIAKIKITYINFCWKWARLAYAVVVRSVFEFRIVDVGSVRLIRNRWMQIFFYKQNQPKQNIQCHWLQHHKSIRKVMFSH